VDNDNSTTAVVPALGTVEVEDKWFPEVDIAYFFAPNWAAELILTYPQEHDVTLGGIDIGTVTHLPPTLTLQYHPSPEGAVRPYIGAGINYTRFNPDLNAAPALGGTDAPLDVDRNSWGLAGQAGVDVRVTPNWYVNLDAKYVQIEAENIRVSGGALAGTEVTDLDVNPWLLSAGVTYRFGSPD
jgi:outer membrane protein